MRGPKKGLTTAERRVVKRLLADGWRNQDIQAQINIGRAATINSARITGVKKDSREREANNLELKEFFETKRAFDPKTGLNAIDDERLVRGREAMLMAVGAFNNPTVKFKTEIFAVLSQIAWTYLLQERLHNHGIKLRKENGLHLTLQDMLEHDLCDVEAAVKVNLLDTKRARDEVEHALLGFSDHLLFQMFQANCLNFDRYLAKWFGAQTRLAADLNFSLQFSRPAIEHLAGLSKEELSTKGWASFNAERELRSRSHLDDQNYQFSVVYMTVQSSKSKSHFRFVQDGTQQHDEISNVLVKFKPGLETHPFKPSEVVRAVEGAIRRKYTLSQHSRDWKAHNVRPTKNSGDPALTNRDYCYYSAPHRDYTYNQAWIDLLVEKHTPITE